MDLQKLIVALENATEGSDELDCKIWCGLNGKRFKESFLTYHRDLQCAYTEPPRRTRHVTRSGDILMYSRSIDAALLLVPVDHCWSVEGLSPGRQGMVRANATVWHRDDHPMTEDTIFEATPALAICIAALKARASISQERKDTEG